MPVGFLREVASSDYTILAIGKSSSVMRSLDILFLDDKDLHGMSIALSDADSASQHLQNAYHEATHAWLDLKSDLPEVQALRERGVANYHNAPVEHGATADPERLFEEAMGAYVGQRAVVYWTALAKLRSWSSSRIDMTIARSVKMMTRAVSEVPMQYDEGMRERVFGYQSPPWYAGHSNDQNRTSQAITREMKSFADERLLENKIPDLFVQAWELTCLWDDLSERAERARQSW